MIAIVTLLYISLIVVVYKVLKIRPNPKNLAAIVVLGLVVIDAIVIFWQFSASFLYRLLVNDPSGLPPAAYAPVGVPRPIASSRTSTSPRLRAPVSLTTSRESAKFVPSASCAPGAAARRRWVPRDGRPISLWSSDFGEGMPA